MKNLLFVLFIVAACILGIGLYRGWFSAETSTSGNKSNINLSVDRDKVQDDINSVKKQSGITTEKKDPVEQSVPPK